MQTIRQWLEQLGLPQYAEVFGKNDVDLEALCLLSDAELEKLGVSLGHRKKLLKAIAELNERRAPTPDAQLIGLSPLSPESVSVEAERRQLTVLFCDLVGSTELAQRLDPESLREVMRDYRRTCTDAIARYEGHVAQYLGDGIMVYFGWPHAHEDDAERCLRAALEVVHAIKDTRAAQALSVRIGIATGAVVVGQTADDEHGEAQLAVGDTPNLAARLQALAGGGQIVIAPATRRLIGTTFELADLGEHALKGIVQPVRAWQVLGLAMRDSRFEAARSEVALTPLVGREEEIALLLRRWQQAKEGEGQVVLVGGEPGIGKSRLTRVLRERLAHERYTPLRYQCSPYHVNSALYPAIEQLERAAAFTREDTAEQKLDKMEALLAGDERQVAQSAPLFAALLSLPTDRYPALNLSPQKQKQETLEALIGQVEALARRQTVLMIHEDAHWIDATSQELMDLLVPRLRDLPVLLIVTHRPEYGARWTDQAHVTVLSLNRLGRRQGAQLVAKVTGGKALPDGVLEQIVAHTDGVPLFIEELTKSVLESQLLNLEGDRYLLKGPLPVLAIPTTLRDSLIARLDRLAPVREIAQIGACIGREFSHELLAALTPLKGERLDKALEQLTKTGLVFRRGTPPDATYTFKHALVQDVAYDSLLKSKRAQLHAQIAQALQRDFSAEVETRPELLAHHLAAAGDAAGAIPYWHKAAAKALDRAAPSDAMAHCGKGLALLSALPDSQERARQELGLQLALGRAAAQGKGWGAPEAEQAFMRARALCETIGDAPEVLPALYGVRSFLTVAGRLVSADAVAHELLERAQRSGDDAAICEGHNAGEIATLLGDFERARMHLDAGARLYDAEAHQGNIKLYGQDSGLINQIFLAYVLYILGYPDQARQAQHRAMALAERRSQPFGVAFAHCRTAGLYLQLGDWTVAGTAAAHAIAVSAERGFGFFLAWSRVLRGLAEIRCSCEASAVDSVREQIEALRALGVKTYLTPTHASLAEAYKIVGSVDKGLDQVAAGLRLIDETEERIAESELSRMQGELMLMRGSQFTSQAAACFERGIEIARRQHAKSWELRSAAALARLWAERGKRNDALDLLAPIYNWFTEGFDTKDLKEAKALLDELS